MKEHWFLTAVKEAETKGKQEGKQEVARNLMQEGWTSERIAATTGLDLETVYSLSAMRISSAD